MEEVRQLVQEEGREARNLVAFHVAVDSPARHNHPRKPRAPPPQRRPPPRAAPRLRSASAGRDKRSELRARYWALLFGDLQRAVGEIYNTVEAHENLSECQEVVLVLENYTRDFNALCEWFRLKWDYDNTPPLQRPQSLAWEIRKTDFVRPDSRKAHSVKSSPSVSGKNSPCLSGHNTPSGKNSPSLTGKTSPGSGKLSPRVTSGHSSTSPKGNIEFFSNKIVSKVTAKPEPKNAKEPRLSDIKEKVSLDVDESPVKVVVEVNGVKEDVKGTSIIEIGKAKEVQNVCAKPVVINSSKQVKGQSNQELSRQAKDTIAKLNVMECSFLEKQLIENAVQNDNMINQDKVVTKQNKTKDVDNTSSVEKVKNDNAESPTKSEDNFADVSNESTPVEDKIYSSGDDNGEKTSSVKDVNVVKEKINKARSEEVEGLDKALKIEDEVKKMETGDEISKDDTKKEDDIKKEHKSAEVKPNRPAYSQAAAKPKLVTKTEVKLPVKTIPIVRSKTVVEMRPSTAPKTQKPFPTKRNQTNNKCSYPFNLTTGRTSLFDNSSVIPTTNKTAVRKPVIQNRNTLGSGDSKNKVDSKPKRPANLVLNGKNDKTDKSNPHLEHNKDYQEYGSSDTIVGQIDMSRIESSDSLRTLVPDDDIANSIEVLNVDANMNDNDGWLTVKSRRFSRESKKQSKSYWANRFHQPSATTSLPTLNMIESPKQETKPIIEPSKLDRAKSEQPQKVEPKPEKPIKVYKTKNEKSKNTSMIRQKSDVTGLKTRSARNKNVSRKAERMRQSKNREGSELTKNRLHSSLESLTGLSRSQESTEEPFDFDKWKTEFKSYFKYLDDDEISDHNEILKSADPSEMSEIAEMTSQIEENERKISLALDFQTEVDQRKLCEEEDLLNRQIMELQQGSDVDMDTETDDTETDAELLSVEVAPQCRSPVPPLGPLAARLEDQYESALAGMSWAERVDTLVMLEALVARDPGRAQQLHSKLSQGIKRRGSFQDALRRLQAKQARAEQQRLDLQTERTKRIHSLLTRVEEVKVAKNQLIEEKRLRMDRRLQKAAENRDQHLKDRVRKAHDEEEKLREIAFIKQLEAENRRHDFLAHCRAHTTRLRQVRRDRLCKLEQKQAREAAVGARRQAIEEARRLHVETLLEKRKERDARVEELKELKRQERDDAAREKAEGVKSRLSALAAAAELEAESLRSRIRHKQDATQQRLATHLQAIRSKATLPRQPTTSESQEQTTKEQEEIEILGRERKERERQKSMKKRARKLRQKLLLSGSEIESLDVQESPMQNNSKIWRILHQLSNTLTNLAKADTKMDNNGKKNGAMVNGNDNDSEIKNENHGKKKKKKVIENGDVNCIINSNDSVSNKNDTACNRNVTESNENNAGSNTNYTASNSSDVGSNTNNTKCNKNDAASNKNEKVEAKKSKKKRDKKQEEPGENNKKSEEKSSKSEGKSSKSEEKSSKNEEKSSKSEEKSSKSEGKSSKSEEKSSKSDEKSSKSEGKSSKSEEKSSKSDEKSSKSEEKSSKSEEKSSKSEEKSSKNEEKSSKSEEKSRKSEEKRLSKTSSVASSLSDMSRVSVRSEKRDVDWSHLEKVVNELSRSFEKEIRNNRDATIHTLKILSQVLSFAVEKEENGVRLTTKSISTAIQLTCRLALTCQLAASYSVNSNLAVHITRLLSGQLERDVESDRAELTLSKQLADCLSIILETVLCATRLHCENKESGKMADGLPDPEGAMLSGLRMRAHNIVTYICLSGVIAKAETSGSARESIQTLITVCAELCQPCDLDTGQERSTALSTLRSTLAGSLCGSRTEFCSLFACVLDEGCEFARAARTARMLRALAVADHRLVQDAFGEGRWPLEFRAAVARLLSQHAPTDREAPRSTQRGPPARPPEQSSSECMVLDLITLVGFVVVNNPQHQETICDGWSAVKTLCTLPASWIVSAPRCHALLPTLAAIAEYPPAAQLIEGELSMQMIEEYVSSPEAQKVKLIQVIKEGRNKKNCTKK